jgi:hypothetical protein
MFTALRQAWRRYVDSLPRDTGPPPLSDAEILRAIHPPHGAEVQQAMADLPALVTAHLPDEVAAKAATGLARRLRPGVTPTAALVGWMRAHHGPKSRNLGLLVVDWKAREELVWQADRIARAHGLEPGWTCDWRPDTSWHGWEARNEPPVGAPLRSLAAHLAGKGLVLLVVQDDDTVAALAVAADQAETLQRLCATLGITEATAATA